jgi:hypothetical protein
MDDLVLLQARFRTIPDRPESIPSPDDSRRFPIPLTTYQMISRHASYQLIAIIIISAFHVCMWVFCSSLLPRRSMTSSTAVTVAGCVMAVSIIIIVFVKCFRCYRSKSKERRLQSVPKMPFPYIYPSPSLCSNCHSLIHHHTARRPEQAFTRPSVPFNSSIEISTIHPINPHQAQLY